MARYLEISIDQGATFVMTLPPVRDFNGVVMNLTGYAANAQLARSYYSHAPYSSDLAGRVYPMLATVTDAESGIVTISLSAASTQELRPDQYVWECELVPISGPSSRIRIAEGLAQVHPRAFKPPVS